MAAAAPIRRARRPRAPISSSPASATTTTSARSRSATTARIAGMRKGAIYIDNTTASAAVARELAAAAEKRGVGFLDAPVSGGQAGAENGQLTVMVGGDQATFDKAKPVIDAYAKMVGLMGPVGAGPAHQDGQPDLHRRPRAGAVRGHPFRQESRARRGEGDRRHLQGRGAVLADGEPLEDDERGTVHVRLRGRTGCARTCRSALAEARENGAQLPVAALVDQFYSEIQAMGGGRWDTSSLIARLERE